ncbi:hypothetical protein BOSEA31B_15096 [Hyphomicrobiales bacterium]|nr:hypothetical protein BOSEA31B_15096 [Hyphomicrobiales bacterium]CAH1701585.1 hypothetical protein BOSEA1005_21284 [Hyphomicrobiales bacterium]CAI0345753.1 hypothetical protein BO1005MUT1_430003 [Hyphomicrobiales bacterium]
MVALRLDLHQASVPDQPKRLAGLGPHSRPSGGGDREHYPTSLGAQRIARWEERDLGFRVVPPYDATTGGTCERHTQLKRVHGPIAALRRRGRSAGSGTPPAFSNPRRTSRLSARGSGGNFSLRKLLRSRRCRTYSDMRFKPHSAKGSTARHFAP